LLCPEPYGFRAARLTTPGAPLPTNLYATPRDEACCPAKSNMKAPKEAEII